MTASALLPSLSTLNGAWRTLLVKTDGRLGAGLFCFEQLVTE